MTLTANDSTQEFTSCTEVLVFHYTGTQSYTSSELLVKLSSLPTKGAVYATNNIEAKLDTHYSFQSLTYRADDCDNTYNDILTYKISYESNESNTSSITLIKYVELSVSVSQHTYTYEKNTQNKYIIPNKSHNIDLIYSLENTHVYPWMHKDENFEKNGSMSFNPGNVSAGVYPIEINYISRDINVWSYNGNINYTIEIVENVSSDLKTGLVIMLAGCLSAWITAFIPAFYEKLIYKLNNDCGYNLSDFSNTSAGQYYFKSTIGSNIGYVCGLDGMCTEVHIEQNLDHIANNI